MGVGRFYYSSKKTKNQNALDRMQPVTPKLFEGLVSDYPPAAEKLKQEFKKINDKETNDYNSIIAFLKVYSEKNNLIISPDFKRWNPGLWNYY